MTTWTNCELSKVAEVQTGPFGSQLKNEQYITGGTPVVTVEHINNFRIADFDFPSVTEEDKNRLSKYLLKAGDIVFTRVGSVDLSAWVKPEQDGWMFSSRMLRVRPNEEVNSHFLSYFFQQKSFRDYILNISVGATMPSINTEILQGIPISFPPLPEQKAIASVLSSLDDKIDLLHRQNKTLEAMAETFFRQWFVEEAQDDWEEGVIKDLIEVLSGFAFKSSSFVESGKYRLITIKGVQDGYLDKTNAARINDIPSRMPKYCFLQDKDILLSLTGNVGRCCLVDCSDLLLNQRVAILQPRNNRNWVFTYILFRQIRMKKALEDLAKGTAQANLSPIELADMHLQIPSEYLLEKFSEEVTLLLEKIMSNKSQISTLAKLRDTLLPKLMSGEVRIN